MDPFKVLGVPEGSVRDKADLERVRQRSKEIFKRYAKEKRDPEAKRVLEAFELLKRRFKSQPPCVGASGGGKPKLSSEGPAVGARRPGPDAASKEVERKSSDAAGRATNAALKAAFAVPGVSAKPGKAKMQEAKSRDATSQQGPGSGGHRHAGVVHAAGGSREQRGDATKRQAARPPRGTSLSRQGSGGCATSVGPTLLTLPRLDRAASGCGGGHETPLPGAARAPAAKRQRVAGGASIPGKGAGASNGSKSSLATTYTCACGQVYKKQSLPRVVPGTGGFVCPPCRMRVMDPLNPMLDGSRGLLKLIVVHPPVVPKDARQEARFKFQVHLPHLHQWRKLGQNVDIRMCLLNTFQAHHAWPKSLTFKMNGRHVLTVDPPHAGHKRRDVPHRISGDLKAGLNIGEVTLKDPCIQRYALAVVRTSPQLPRQLCKHVEFMAEDDCKLRIHNLLFSSMLEGSGTEVQCPGSDRCRLICPITLLKMETPVRGRKCRHLQCFDLQAYLLSNMRMGNHKNRWHCPICDLILRPPKDLFVDTYVLKILSGTEPEDEEVVFDEGSGWQVSAKANTAANSDSEDSEGAEFFRNFPQTQTADVDDQAAGGVAGASQHLAEVDKIDEDGKSDEDEATVNGPASSPGNDSGCELIEGDEDADEADDVEALDPLPTPCESPWPAESPDVHEQDAQQADADEDDGDVGDEHDGADADYGDEDDEDPDDAEDRRIAALFPAASPAESVAAEEEDERSPSPAEAADEASDNEGVVAFTDPYGAFLEADGRVAIAFDPDGDGIEDPSSSPEAEGVSGLLAAAMAVDSDEGSGSPVSVPRAENGDGAPGEVASLQRKPSKVKVNLSFEEDSSEPEDDEL